MKESQSFKLSNKFSLFLENGLNISTVQDPCWGCHRAELKSECDVWMVLLEDVFCSMIIHIERRQNESPHIVTFSSDLKPVDEGGKN